VAAAAYKKFFRRKGARGQHMTLTQGLVFALTMLILFGGLFYTIWSFRREPPAPLKARRPAPRDRS
jgi:hypothetical protein